MLNSTNPVIIRKTFNYQTCDFRGLTPDITRELLNEYIDKIGMQLVWLKVDS